MDTRSQILKAAAVVFSRSGFTGGSTRAIARRARVNEGSIFRLFRTKRRLYLEALKRQIEDAIVFPPGMETPEAFVGALLAAWKQNPTAMRSGGKRLTRQKRITN